ncbi:MAG: NADH:flavin oxidoreductase [Luteitalea sp.]|nr:NADH:flavin oxidoreductase [Luteitalea sp.]
MSSYARVASLKTPEQFLAHLAGLGIELPLAPTLLTGPDAPLAAPVPLGRLTAGNRFAVLPMEGWDGTLDGRPSELTIRRWTHFGQSGAKLIWGGEAFAVRHDGRANPNQLVMGPHAEGDLTRLRETLVSAHATSFGTTSDLVVGLQLTHSGRYARPDPDGQPRPFIVYRHPLLDRRLPPGTVLTLMSDADIERLVDDFVAAARVAARAGFHFVDIKHCHGYLAHELLSGVDRPGRFGGSFENRTRFLRLVVDGIRAAQPGLDIGVRLSAFDSIPYSKNGDGVGRPTADAEGYRYAFSALRDPGALPNLDDARRLLQLLRELDVRLVCISAGSPYYNPHIQRPALFPPSDGYLPPEDPLVGVARQIQVTSQLKRAFPDLVLVGSAYSYLQEWLPHVAQAMVQQRGVDVVGIGRMILAYPTLPADVLAGRPLQRKSICRTFSDCTTGPRHGLVSGCFPLDRFYAAHPDAARLKEVKARLP